MTLAYYGGQNMQGKVVILLVDFKAFDSSEAVTRGFPCKKVFLKIFQNSQENNWVRVSFFIFFLK